MMKTISGKMFFTLIFLAGVMYCSSSPPRNNFNPSDDYDLTDLVEIWPINKMASKVLFIYKYDKIMFQIHHDIFQSEPYYEKKNVIRLYDIDFTLKIFAMFGELITKLRINYETLPTEQRVVINEQIAKHCLNSLGHLEIRSSVGDELMSLKGPFLQVENVSIVNQLMDESQFGILKTNGLNINEIFPNVRRLRVKGVSFTDPMWLEQKLLQLEHLSLNLKHKNHENIERIVQLNPQLESISLNEASWDLLKKINQHVPKLTGLKLTNMALDKYEGENIHFQNLKVFQFDDYTKSLEKSHISFRTLEEFECYKSFDKFYDIFIQNKNLKKIEIGKINNEQLMEIAEELTHLEEILAIYNTNGSTEEVIQFLQIANNLKVIVFAYVDPITQKAIADRLGNEWETVTENSGFTLILRKNRVC